MTILPLALLLTFQLSPQPGQPEYRQPQITVFDGTVYLTYGAGNTIYFASSEAGANGFSEPVKVAEPRRLALGRHRGPRISVTRNAIVISAVVGEQGGGKDGDLTAWRSVDGGKSWSRRVAINDVGASAREGLHDMAAGEDGVVFATWLDLRNGATELYGSYSTDGGASWSENLRIYRSPDGTICQCCHPSAVMGHEGSIYVMWRNALRGARDMYLAKSGDGQKSFNKAQKLGRGTWMLDACPMDGGGIALGPQGELHSIWRRERDIFLAQPGQKELRIGTGKDPSVAVARDGLYAVWTEGNRLIAKTPNKKEPFELSASGSYCDLAGDGPVYAAWEDSGRIRVERLDTK